VRTWMVTGAAATTGALVAGAGAAVAGAGAAVAGAGALVAGAGAGVLAAQPTTLKTRMRVIIPTNNLLMVRIFFSFE
jgi:hypothetical protein